MRVTLKYSNMLKLSFFLLTTLFTFFYSALASYDSLSTQQVYFNGNYFSHRTHTSHHTLGDVADCIGNRSEVYVGMEDNTIILYSHIASSGWVIECDDIVLDCFELLEISGSFQSQVIDDLEKLPDNAVHIDHADRSLRSHVNMNN